MRDGRSRPACARSLGGDRVRLRWRYSLGGFAGVVVAREEGGQRCALLLRYAGPDAQRLGQPAGIREQALGLPGHVGLLEMVDQLRRHLALALAHGLENAGLGDAAEIVVGRRPPAVFDEVEPDCGRESVGLGDALLDTVLGDAIIAVAALVECGDAEADAMRQQRCAAGILQTMKPGPERRVILRHVGLPAIMPRLDRLRR